LRSTWFSQSRAAVVCVAVAALAGCYVPAPPSEGGRNDTDSGPGKRQQALLLTPAQELALGTKLYRQILAESDVVPQDEAPAIKVRHVGERIARAASIPALQREINLRLRGYRFEWEFNVLRDRQINAFCLPGGKVAVFSGMMHVVENDDQLATVMGHEIAHALAHHASERLAQQQMLAQARQVAEGGAGADQRLLGLLAFSGPLQGLAHDRFQEAEADHIGVFLMTFAGYDPRQAVVFWTRMNRLSGQHGRLPEILSDHPSDAHRIAKMRAWVPWALGAKKAFDEGNIVPAAR
jgi:metalloendopeptidase OMA1, mitochondrial